MNDQGFKRGTALALLDLKPETLRYWKVRLDPCPKRNAFSSRCLLAYWILKQLIQHRGSHARYLADFDLRPLFYRCETASLIDITESCLVLDHAVKSVYFEKLGLKNDRYDYHTEKIELTLIVREYTARLLNFGLA